MKVRIALSLALSVLLCLSACDIASTWESTSSNADSCEENDSIDTAFAISSALQTLFMNFFDDGDDYYAYSVTKDKTYSVVTSVPSGHATDPCIQVFGIDKTTLVVSGVDDATGTNYQSASFTAVASGDYYIRVYSGDGSTGVSLGYNLIINEN